jgi:hypothetical protein
MPLMLLATGMFGVAAFSASYAAELAEGRRGVWIDITTGLAVWGVNVPLLLLASCLGYETFRFGWRWADEYAVTATPDALVPHGSLLLKPIPWQELRDIRFVKLGRVPTLVVKTRAGRTHAIKGVANGDREAERFAERARAMLPDAADSRALI